MTKNKFNIIFRFQQWIGGENGQIFLHYAYNWGASIVILGTLFKLNHLPEANLFLYVGMGTEIFVFFISAFDVSSIVSNTPISEEKGSITHQQLTPTKEEKHFNESLSKVKTEMNLLHSQLKVINKLFSRIIRAFSPK